MGCFQRSQQLKATCYARRLTRLVHGTSRLALVPIRTGISKISRRSSRLHQNQFPRGFFTSPNQRNIGFSKGPPTIVTVAISGILGGLLIYSLYPGDELRRSRIVTQTEKGLKRTNDDAQLQAEDTAWSAFASRFERFSNVTDIEWSTLSDRLVDMILPDWSRTLPSQIRKLQRELSVKDGSLANEIWRDAHDPFIHPEIQYSARVRVSEDLCDEEKEFLARRKKVATAALAKYLGLDEKDVHPDDVPTIAICGSGGGLRALVAGTGSLLATQEDGLFDCTTYTAGVSGSCWLQSLYNSSVTNRQFDRIVDHLKSRIGVHFAYPPAAFSSVTSAPTSKLLLSSLVEKLRGDPNADFGLVDAYGILLAARLLVPKGELGVNEKDFKLSSQREYIKYGENPLPIYTAVRHEIPDIANKLSKSGVTSPERAEEIAKKEAWFQWFELTPYEFFCEEFNAGIPTWALGRRFNDGEDVPPESNGFHLPELRMPIMMGIFGSAFCATLSHYYREIRPLVKSLTGFAAIDGMIYGYNTDLEKVHPIDPAQIPNFTYNMEGKLRFTTPTAICDNEYIQLMDAGMSNNLPLYPLLRPGRDIDIIVAFDASADVKTDNWLSVADGYARQRGIKGWPVGVGWPKATDSVQTIEQQLESAQAKSPADAEAKVHQAQQGQGDGRVETRSKPPTPTTEPSDKAKHDISHPEDSDLGYCTIWVGSKEERSSEPPPPTKAKPLTDDTLAWQLKEPNAGMTIVYLPFLANPKVEGVNPAESDYMSTWNFVYTPEQVDKVVALARANFAEGKDQVRRCVRAVYERKKKMREDHEAAVKREVYRRLVRLGIADKLGEGDHFS
ncbi:FabD/lysophospholipase-like protein [Annulohypoxylon maeteangense]|uniref:FabD/lysophospholipase-like protein n=1 Tax=Annulohypoxylon maeteangense TaxID=1927788 RepID=UPI0020080E6A|nr:FabD/lysophospholipase-like protein [Annulohypoxylon maeteangense]KAI0888965.1 FabD/lysophospholipase-like protein [Annulohypoxylon maeteangense]